MRDETRDHKAYRAQAILLAMILAGCGGGGGGGGGAGLAVPPAANPGTQTADANVPGGGDGLAPQLIADCRPEQCGVDAMGNYTGAGIGVWRYVNEGGRQVDLPISLGALNGKSITLVYTNRTNAPVAMPSVALTSAPYVASPALRSQRHAAQPHGFNALPEMLGPVDLSSRLAGDDGPQRALRAGVAARVYAIGQSRTWWISQPDNTMSPRTATLRATRTAPDGRVVNLWVEDGEYGPGKLNETMVETFSRRFADGDSSVYSMVVGLAGQPWGNHRYGTRLIADDQSMDIVFVNFNRDNHPYGMIGYFWANNNFIRDPGHRYGQYSNESLSFYMDTETIYRANGDEGMKVQLSTLGHELIHMINFYQRGVSMTPVNGRYFTFDTFLEETTASMVEDIIGTRLEVGYNALRDHSFGDWVQNGLNNCSYTDWNNNPNTACFSYSIAASFGGYLLRQYGIEFYGKLLRNDSSTNSLAVLDDAIRREDGSGYLGAMGRWGAMAALLPASGSPPRFGFPERSEGGYTLPGIHGPDYAAYVRQPTSVPRELLPYAQFPLRRVPVGGVYQEVVPVPSGTALTVVVR